MINTNMKNLYESSYLLPKSNTLHPQAVQAVIQRVTKSEDLTDLLIDVEDYMDTNNLWSFANWIDGIVVAGPFVSKYWVKLTLKYPYKKMPDPAGGMRLTKHGTKISYRIGKEQKPIKIKSPDDYQPGTKKARIKLVKIWLVEILIPRRLVENLSKTVMDLYDEDVDTNTLDDADVQGITSDQAVDQNTNISGGSADATGENGMDLGGTQ